MAEEVCILVRACEGGARAMLSGSCRKAPCQEGSDCTFVSRTPLRSRPTQAVDAVPMYVPWYNPLLLL